ncbi:MAG: winged helix-turn-helix domain-containing protein [Microthrixaceae bacterium]
MAAEPRVAERAARHAALGDPVRLSVVDELVVSDRSPVELSRLVGIESNLLAHHLDILEEAGLIERSRSSGDGRRRYVHLRRSLSSAPCRAVPWPSDPLCSSVRRTRRAANSLRRRCRGADRRTGRLGRDAPVRAGTPQAVAACAGLDLTGEQPGR